MTPQQEEKYLRALAPGMEVRAKDENLILGNWYRVGGWVKVSDGSDVMKVELGIYGTSGRKVVDMKYKDLTCETIRVMNIIAPDNLQKFSNSVDEELKARRIK